MAGTDFLENQKNLALEHDHGSQFVEAKLEDCHWHYANKNDDIEIMTLLIISCDIVNIKINLACVLYLQNYLLYNLQSL